MKIKRGIDENLIALSLLPEIGFIYETDLRMFKTILSTNAIKICTYPFK